jgi:hypothetical protein
LVNDDFMAFHSGQTRFEGRCEQTLTTSGVLLGHVWGSAKDFDGSEQLVYEQPY